MTVLLIYLMLAIGVSFMCSILEAVLLSISVGYTEQMKQERPQVGKLITRVRDRLDESISSILILNTFAHTVGAVGVGSQAIGVFGAEWETVIAILLTLAILYFSEIIPKTLGARYWATLAPTACFIIEWLVIIAYPLVWISTRLTGLFGKDGKGEITREELIALAYLGRKGGALGTQESLYLENILRLREFKTEQICTPRTVVHMLERNMTVAEALSDSKTRTFTRIPVYEKTVDHVVGLVIMQDLYEAKLAGKDDTTIGEVMREVQWVSEKLPVMQLLDQFIKQQTHLFLVEDAFGQPTGIVTLEDALETLLGREIVDENDPVEDMQALAKGQYRERLRLRQRRGGSE